MKLHTPVPIWLVIVLLVVTTSLTSAFFLVPTFLGPHQDFTLEVTPPYHVFLASHGTAQNTFNFEVHVRSVNGFSGIVTLSAETPSGVSVSFRSRTGGIVSPIAILGNNDTLTMYPTATSAGNHSITVFGKSGGLSHTTQVPIIVQDITLVDETPQPLIVPHGGKANMTATIAGVNGLSGDLFAATQIPQSNTAGCGAICDIPGTA